MAETPIQRYRRMKRNHQRAMQIAPNLAVPPARCAYCGHARLMHRESFAALPICLASGCDCTEYREVAE